jgi:hypothetical protein
MSKKAITIDFFHAPHRVGGLEGVEPEVALTYFAPHRVGGLEVLVRHKADTRVAPHRVGGLEG